MYMEPNIDRLSKLNHSNFKVGETILFCPKCDWQQFEPYGMKPKCPECMTHLHYTTVDSDLRKLEAIDE